MTKRTFRIKLDKKFLPERGRELLLDLKIYKSNKRSIHEHGRDNLKCIYIADYISFFWVHQYPKHRKIGSEQPNEWLIMQNKVYGQWLLSSVVCCQMMSYFKKQKCLKKRRRKEKKKDQCLLRRSLVEKEYTLNVPPLTRVTYPRTFRLTKSASTIPLLFPLTLIW